MLEMTASGSGLAESSVGGGEVEQMAFIVYLESLFLSYAITMLYIDSILLKC